MDKKEYNKKYRIENKEKIKEINKKCNGKKFNKIIKYTFWVGKSILNN